MSYVVALHCVILYCNNGWHVKDGVVHHSHQQWLVTKRLGGGVTVGVRVRARVRECNYFFLCAGVTKYFVLLSWHVNSTTFTT